jgi:hypothetical protein
MQKGFANARAAAALFPFTPSLSHRLAPAELLLFLETEI